jgi:hypothetical protein
MNPAQARHLERLGHLRESFAAANERLVTRLRNAPDEAARHSRQREGWSASQIGWHVAKVTNRFAGLISGELPGVEQAPEGVRPPPVVTRIEAIALLEASGVRMARALDLVTPERGAGYGIRSPIVGGLINVYQIGEWATAHVIRHNKQAKQLLGG